MCRDDLVVKRESGASKAAKGHNKADSNYNAA